MSDKGRRLAIRNRELLAQRDEARREVERLLMLLRDVRDCGATDIDPRLRYVEVQIDRELWSRLKDESDER